MGFSPADGMALFLSTYLNKIDRKGRVSVPAAFRKTLEDGQYKTLVALQSPALQAVECMSPDRIGLYAASLDNLAKFSDQEGDIAVAVFASAADLGWDNEGRIILPEPMLAHTGITEQALFAGAGQTFQIWEPAAFKQRQAEARERAKLGKLTLNLMSGNGGGKS
jgi:MraZ protein